MRLMKYNTEIVYTKGTNMYIVDMLSRAFLKGTNMYIADMLSRAFLKGSSLEQSDLEQVNSVKYLPTREERLQILETQQDENLEALKQIIMSGWPENKSDVPPTLVPYYGM